MRTFPWHEASERRLTELAATCGPTEIARILAKEFNFPLSPDAARAKRDKLRLGIGAVSAWTPERSELATKMWSQGASAGEIAKALDCGISRNAVISKMYRTEVTVRPKAQPQPPKPKRPKKTAVEAGMLSGVIRKANEARKAAKPGRLAAVLPEVFTATVVGGGGFCELDSGKWDARPVPDSKPALLIDLENDQCRWPLEEQDGIRGRFLMCGAPRVDDKCSYCMLHWRRSRGLGTPSERRAAA